MQPCASRSHRSSRTGAGPFFVTGEHLDEFAAAYSGMVGDAHPARAHGAGKPAACFSHGLWERGVLMAKGTTELTAAASTTGAWQSGSRLTALRESRPSSTGATQDQRHCRARRVIPTKYPTSTHVDTGSRVAAIAP